MSDRKPLSLVCEDYTVYITVAASNAGKSTLAKNIELELRQYNANPVLLSSDDIRRELIGDYSLDKYDDRMLEVSQQAFELLYAKLKHNISYPVNRKFVIIDSTGLNSKFRQDIINICRANNYKVVCLLFEYKDRKDWFINEGGNNYIINKHLNKLQKEVYRDIKASDYHKIVRITAPISELNLTYIEDKNNLVVDGNNYTVIGDVHGCVDELNTLLGSIDSTPILVGDWIDVKDDDLTSANDWNAAIIDYLYEKPHILLVKGNHEENLYKHIIKEDYTESPYFNSRSLIASSDEYRDKFIELYNRSYTTIRGKGFIVSHAPCKAKYLLTDTDKPTNLHYKKEDDKSAIINDIYNDKSYNTCWPLHLYGHLTFNKPARTKWSIGLDTGVGYGNVLTGYNVAAKEFITIKAKCNSSYVVLDDYKSVVQDLTSKLDDDDSKKLHGFIRNKTMYVSGTMCPADSFDTELESIISALNYYKSKGQTQVIIQPKYMGSRAQVLLAPEGVSVYTRSGYKLKLTDELEQAVSNLELSLVKNKVFGQWLDKLGSWSNVLLDCELLPWSFLAKGLISDTFEGYYYSHKIHIDNMTKYGLYNDLAAYKVSDNYKNGVISSNKEVTNFNSWKYLDTSDELTLFGQELDKYKVDEAPYFQAFNILKVEGEDKVLYSNSQFSRFNNEELFSLLNSPYHVISVDDIDNAYNAINQYNKLEGVVVKPYYNSEGQAPYIKVRSRDYLRLVYGYDYTQHLDKLIRDKSITGKLNISIKEWQYGNKLLDIHSSLMTEDNMEYTNNLIRLIFELKAEQRLDPRL